MGSENAEEGRSNTSDLKPFLSKKTFACSFPASHASKRRAIPFSDFSAALAGREKKGKKVTTRKSIDWQSIIGIMGS
jgi:hypothetical protein